MLRDDAVEDGAWLARNSLFTVLLAIGSPSIIGVLDITGLNLWFLCVLPFQENRHDNMVAVQSKSYSFTYFIFIYKSSHNIVKNASNIVNVRIPTSREPHGWLNPNHVNVLNETCHKKAPQTVTVRVTILKCITS